LRRNPLGLLERAGRHVDLVRKVGGAEGDGRPTSRAERARPVVRGAEAHRLTRQESEAGNRNREPGDERSTAHAPADRAMTVRLVGARALRAVAHEAAETMTFHHALITRRGG